jgi:hypothetical protein
MMDTTLFQKPAIMAILVFLSIYLVFFLIRILADMFIVGIAFTSAVVIYNMPAFYSEYRNLLQTLLPFNKIGLKLSEQPDGMSFLIIAVCIVLGAVILCLPFLPFSATYRQILGIERLGKSDEAQIRQWVTEEIEHHR